MHYSNGKSSVPRNQASFYTERHVRNQPVCRRPSEPPALPLPRDDTEAPTAAGSFRRGSWYSWCRGDDGKDSDASDSKLLAREGEAWRSRQPLSRERERCCSKTLSSPRGSGASKAGVSVSKKFDRLGTSRWRRRSLPVPWPDSDARFVRQDDHGDLSPEYLRSSILLCSSFPRLWLSLESIIYACD